MRARGLQRWSRSGLAVLAAIVVVVAGCGASSAGPDGGQPESKVAETNVAEASRLDDARPPSDASDDALVDTISVETYGADTNECAARAFVERIGGDELRAIGWTPDVVEVSAVDEACLESWFGEERRERALAVFELSQAYRWIDDPSPLVEQLDGLNQLATMGELSASELDQLNDCFAR